MSDAQKDPQMELDELLSRQKLLAEQIAQKRGHARESALQTIKRLYESHAFEYKDVKDFIKVTATRKTAPRKTAARKKRGT